MYIGSMSRLVWLSVAALLFTVHVARAGVDLNLEAGAGYSDNIRRVNTNEEEEKIGTLGVDLLWQEETRRLNADVMVDVAYFEYLDDTFDSEVVGLADGTITLGILPERITWLVQDTFGQAQSDPFAPVTPENREDVNYFTTGPDLFLHMGSAASLNVFARYSSTDYEESLIDADRTSFGFALARNPSQRSQIALNAIAEQTDFELGIDQDYDRESAFLSYSMDAARTDLSTELGYTWLKPDGGERTGGLLANVAVIRDISASSTLHLELGTEFTDAGDALRGAIEGGAVGGPDVTATADPFETRIASLRWNFLRNRTGFSLGASWNEDRYEEQTALDRTRMAYEATFTRRLSPTLDFSFLAFLNDEDFDNADLQSDELSLLTRLTWQAGRTISFTISLERSDRNTSDGLNEYVENRAYLTFGYRPISTYEPSSAP